MYGRVLIPTGAFLGTLTAARLAAEACGVPTLIVSPGAVFPPRGTSSRSASAEETGLDVADVHARRETIIAAWHPSDPERRSRD